MTASRVRATAWALTVGVVLADSSIVTLALPEILREYDTSVFGVSWVLTVYNVFLAAAILPASKLARRAPAELWAIGLSVFALASLTCALAPSIGVLIVARCVQALGGAAAVAGAIELLALARGSHGAGARLWGAAGTAGLALGPAIGGLLTELFSWQSIFVLQVPLLTLLAATRTPEREREAGPEGPKDLRPEVGLGLISAGLTAALFLLVILLTEGWGFSPLGAAAVVSVIPAATLAAGRLHRSHANAWNLASAGAIATAGGLAALGVLPGASADLTIAPQLLIGAGLALSIPVLTQEALGRRDPDGSRAAATLAARHAGIVTGIVLLTPLLSLQLDSQHDAGRDAATALLLDAPLSPTTKLETGTAIGQVIDDADGQLPPVSRAFAEVEPDQDERAALDELEAGIDDQLERAATHAFNLPFLGAGLLAALALIPLIRLKREHDR
jgi:MFS family permease